MLRQAYSEKIERARTYVMETATYYIIFMTLVGFLFSIFVALPMSYFYGGDIPENLKILVACGMWAFLLFILIFIFLIALLTALKIVITGDTDEEADTLIYLIVLFIGYAMFFVVFTKGLFS